jgi:hypothetical protein
MKTINKIGICLLLICSAAMRLTAQEDFSEGFGSDDFGSGFGSDDFGSGFGSDDSGSGFGSDDFGSSWDSGSESSLDITGELKVGGRGYFDDDPGSSTDTIAEGQLQFEYKADKSEMLLDFTALPDTIDMNEASLRYFSEQGTLEVGYMKKVWGKGDDLHVMNLLNAQDLTDFINPDYLDTLEPEWMLSFTLPVRQMGQIEAVYAPRFTGDILSTSGRWTLYQTKGILELSEAVVMTQASQIYQTTYSRMINEGYSAQEAEAAASLAQTEYLSDNSSSDSFYEDTDNWSMSQAALYYTDTFGPVDLGFLYYYGYYGMPAVELEYTGSSLTGLELGYNRMHAFGMDFGWVLGSLNTRGELAYYMTDDTKGDDPEVYNHRVKWVGGFDTDLPVSRLNFNIQETGTYILNKNKIESGDIEYDSDKTYTENLIVVKLNDKYNHEKVTLGVTGMYHWEKEGWMINPEIEIDFDDNLTFKGESSLFGGSDKDNSLFHQFNDNDFVQLELIYSFKK